MTFTSSKNTTPKLKQSCVTLLLLVMLRAFACAEAEPRHMRSRLLGKSSKKNSGPSLDSQESVGLASKSTKSTKSSKPNTSKRTTDTEDYDNPATTICGGSISCGENVTNTPVCTDPPSGAAFITTGEGCIQDGTCGSTSTNYGNVTCDGDNCSVIADGFFFIAFPGVPEDFDLTCTLEADLEAQILGFLGDELNDEENVQVLSVAIIEWTVATSTAGTTTTTNLSVKVFVTIKLDLCYASEIEDASNPEITQEQLESCACSRRRVFEEPDPSWHRELWGCTYNEEILCQACNSFDYCYCPCGEVGFRRHLGDMYEKSNELFIYEKAGLRGLQANATECCQSGDFICRIQNDVPEFENVTEVNSVINVTDTSNLAQCVNTESLVDSGEVPGDGLACGPINSTCPQEGELPETEKCCEDTVSCECYICGWMNSFACCEGSCPANPSCGGR